MSFRLIYGSSLCDVRFRSYEGFCQTAPGQPRGYPYFLGALPLTSTPLGQAPIKLNQSPAQIRCPFWASSSRLGVSAPALLAFEPLLQRCSFFSLWFSLSFSGADGASSSVSSANYCSFVAASLPPLCLFPSASKEEQIKMAAPLASALAGRVDVRD